MQKITLTTLLLFFILTGYGHADIASMRDDLNKRVITFEKFVSYTGHTLVAAANKDTFKQYFLTDDPAEKIKLKHKIDYLSLNTQAKFNVDEMCLINKKGKEISRIVYQEIAPDKDLSAEEASAPFFDPAFNINAGEYHLSAPYVSADSLRWVICFATPIVLADGSKPAIYHYEVSQYAVQGVLNKGLAQTPDRILIVVNQEGYVVSDSRTKFKLEYNIADTEMSTPFSDYFPKMADHIPGLPTSLVATQGELSGVATINDNSYDYLAQPLGYNGWTMILLHPQG